ncbi:MAG TPA: 50S ribosomal protein L11 methyltransferase [Burkholderiales bacterium]|nr:50S ribosomal protein L11 methyltransferase [Burkholderiales bacterium]
MPWLSISIEMDPASAEAYSEALMEAGAESVALEPEGACVRVTALAPGGADPHALIDAASGIAQQATPAFRVAVLEDEDWVRRSQSQFGPIRLSAGLWIVPSWHEPPDPAAIAVRLDPGLAFGTGSHASTRLILQRLLCCLRKGDHVLDYGCGSGILAIVAAKLGAREIAAVDIDPQALETTTANASTNGVSLRAVLPEQLAAGTYDVVLANILAGPLIALEAQLAARTRTGGRILLSGILHTQAADVAAAYARDFEVSVGAAEEGWALVEGLRR